MRKSTWISRIFVFIAVVALSVAVFAACDKNETPQTPTTPVPVQSITITGKPDGEVDVSTGTIQLGISYTPTENVEEFSVKWSSNTQSVASVDANGLVTLSGAGRTTITAEVIGNASVKDSFSLTVTDSAVAVSSITITGRPVSDTVEVGAEPIQLGYTYAPDNASDFAVEWYSSTSSVATVDANGLVTVHGAGASEISVTVKGTSVSDKFTLLVGAAVVEVTGVTIGNKPDGNTLRAGTSWTLDYTFQPEEAVAFNVEWSSSDPDVATVGENGAVTAEGAGKTTITLKVAGKEISDSFELTVSAALDPLHEDFEYATIVNSSGSGNYSLIKNNYDHVTVELTSDTNEVPTGGSGTALKVSTTDNGYPGAQLTPSALPVAGESYTLSIDLRMLTGGATLYCNINVDGTTLSNPPAVTLEENESGKLTGTFTVPETIASFRLEVFAINSAAGEMAFAIDNIKIDIVPTIEIDRPENDMVILENGTLTLTAKTNIDGASIVWTSGTTSVADFVDGNNVLTLKEAGETVITAKITVNGQEVEDHFTLKVLGTGVELVDPPTNMKIGDEQTVEIVVTGEIGGTLSASADPTGVVEVSVSGNTLTIKAVGEGTATVTVGSGDYEDTFTVNVTSGAIVEDFEGMEAGSEITSDLYTIAVEQSSTLSVTDSADQIPENGGSKALLVSMEGRANFYPGAKITPKDSLTVGGTYKFTLNVRSISAVTRVYMKLEGNNDGPYNTNVGLEVGASGTITNTITVSKAQPEILIFIISADGNTETFSIDNVTIEEVPSVIITGRPANDSARVDDGTVQLGYEFFGGASADSASWASSAPEVATVDASTGLVTPLTAGKTTITVTAGDYTASFELTATDPTLIASEDFEDNFEVTHEGDWVGTGEEISFSSGSNSTFDMQYSETPEHIPEGGSGHCLFWQPYNGTNNWAGLNFNGIPFEAGKTYEINFLVKLVEDVASSGFYVFYQIDSNPNVTLATLNFDGAGSTVNFSAQFTVPEGSSQVKLWLSMQTIDGGKLALDNVTIYEI